ncbi:hypothetical protein CC86DRAFT_404500 [Ophiobolus disseminans]|uniref:Uncharacterized protein n=1 Tax=Ophiobolus disseminans TaxID=1469910 RepID=A0A6A7A7D0_9PLEO|nr:hypothetical protein CC86DRAFT_404500 [Ophiobolus disseminans]
MSAAAAPPPPPPPGGGPGKGFSGHNSPGKQKDTRQRGDGRTAVTAFWSQELWNKPNQRQFIVHRRINPVPNKWVRTTFDEARFDAQTGFSVWEVGARASRRVNLVKGTLEFQPYQWQNLQIEQEERRRVANREPLGGEENILDGVEEEYVGQDPAVFDSPERKSPPSRYSLDSRGQNPGASPGAPSTPRRRGGDQRSSPLNPNSGGSGGSRGGRGQGPRSPGSPSVGRGGRDGGSPA